MAGREEGRKLYRAGTDGARLSCYRHRGEACEEKGAAKREGRWREMRVAGVDGGCPWGGMDGGRIRAARSTGRGWGRRIGWADGRGWGTRRKWDLGNAAWERRGRGRGQTDLGFQRVRRRRALLYQTHAFRPSDRYPTAHGPLPKCPTGPEVRARLGQFQPSYDRKNF